VRGDNSSKERGEKEVRGKAEGIERQDVQEDKIWSTCDEVQDRTSVGDCTRKLKQVTGCYYCL
jgi:hypothetical protein